MNYTYNVNTYTKVSGGDFGVWSVLLAAAHPTAEKWFIELWMDVWMDEFYENINSNKLR